MILQEKSFFKRVNAKLSQPNIFILNNRWDCSAGEDTATRDEVSSITTATVSRDVTTVSRDVIAVSCDVIAVSRDVTTVSRDVAKG